MAPFEEAAAPAVLARLAEGDGRLEAAVQARLERLDVRFAVHRGSTFPLDPVPRVIASDEWDHLKVGLAQRVKALNAFVADAYGPRRIVQAGVVPSRVIETAEHYEPAMRGVEPPGGIWVGVAGLDLVRDANGEFLVLEDNLMTPSGFGYAVAARLAVGESLELGPGEGPRDLGGVPALLAGTLRAGAARESEPYLIVLSEGPENGAYWEHAWAARELGVPLVAPSELELDGDTLKHGPHTVDAVYRRTNADLLSTDVGKLLGPPLRAGTLGVLNAFGTGVGDDKLTHAYVEDMIRFYLGEEPRLRSVPTLDLARRDHLEQALDTFDDLVVKPRAGHGGHGVVVCPHAEPEDVAAARETVRKAPEEWVAQPLVDLSTHPTLVDGVLAPRHVDLRPFVFMHGPDHPRVMPGGLTRFATAEGSLVVNSTQEGGFKDTWVMP